MLGAVYGDIIGSYYENHCTKKYDFPLMCESTFTDDSVLLAAVCMAILLNPKPVTGRELKRRALEYAVQYKQYYSYFPDAGYGSMFREWASSRQMFRQRSFGNGAAMRAVPIGYAYAELEQVLLQTKASCLYTHHHREAIKAAQAVAASVWLARKTHDKEHIRAYIAGQFGYDMDLKLDEIRPHYSFDSSAGYSVPPAIMAFLESSDYESAVRNAVSLGGDADTMACIAGGIAEAFYEVIPDTIRRFCDSRLDITIKTAVRDLKQYCADSEII